MFFKASLFLSISNMQYAFCINMVCSLCKWCRFTKGYHIFLAWAQIELIRVFFFFLFFMIEITNNLIHQVHVTHNVCNPSMILSHYVKMSLKFDSFEKASTKGLNVGTR